MFPSVYVSPLKLHSVTKINLHGISGSALFLNHLKFAFLLFSHLYLGTLVVNIDEVLCILQFQSAIPRGVVVVNIYVVNPL